MTFPRWNHGRPPVVNPQQPDKPADAVSVEAKEVLVTGENVSVQGQDEATKQRELSAVAGLAAKAVDEEDRKRAVALRDVEQQSKQERLDAFNERREIRVMDATEAADIRAKDFRKIMLGIIVAAIPTTLVAATGAYISYRDAAVNLSTHKLVNSGSLVQLKINLRSARRIYALTMDPEDKKDVEDAEAAVNEHLAKQKLADEASK